MHDDDQLIDAVHSQTVRSWLAENPDHPKADALAATCDRIESQTRAETERLARVLTGVDLWPDTSAQLHRMEIAAPDRTSARQVVELLSSDGYEPWHRWTDGALESFYRSANSASLVRLDEPALTAELIWPESRIPVPLRSTARDWRLFSLPSAAWPIYSVIRPVRLLLDRLGVLPDQPPVLGPILGTPNSLIEPLLDFAGIGANDHVVDVGCGDARLAIAAARRGGTATGIELDSTLVSIARSRVAAAGLEGRVDIVEGDAATADLTNATVVLAFLPGEVMGGLVQSARERGFRGPIVSHEQERVHTDRSPERSEVLIGADALTVAHHW